MPRSVHPPHRPHPSVTLPGADPWRDRKRRRRDLGEEADLCGKSLFELRASVPGLFELSRVEGGEVERGNEMILQAENSSESVGRGRGSQAGPETRPVSVVGLPRTLGLGARPGPRATRGREGLTLSLRLNGAIRQGSEERRESNRSLSPRCVSFNFLPLASSRAPGGRRRVSARENAGGGTRGSWRRVDGLRSTRVVFCWVDVQSLAARPRKNRSSGGPSAAISAIDFRGLHRPPPLLPFPCASALPSPLRHLPTCSDVLRTYSKTFPSSQLETCSRSSPCYTGASSCHSSRSSLARYLRALPQLS